MKDPLIGARINRYEIREAVHRSDVIGIYKAYDTKLERYVLLKTILHSADYSTQARDFFLTESKTLAKLVHPNIAKVLDFGFENQNLYMISEYTAGRTLSDLMTNPIPWQEAVKILLPIADALTYAHERGIIHRDLKPDNILINLDNQPVLGDFSLIRIIEEEETRDMTGTNVGLGSAGYISPEQGQGMDVDFRSDIYSLGVIFYEMVTGKKMFYASSSMEIVIQHIMSDPPRPRSLVPSLPRSVEAIILKALSKDREKRYQSMEEFAAVINSAAQTAGRVRPPLSRRTKIMIATFVFGFLLLLTGGGVVYQATRPTPTQSETSTQVRQTESPIATDSTASPTKPPSPSVTVTKTPDGNTWSKYQLPSVPVLPGARLPSGEAKISSGNVANLRELARWGNPDIRHFVFINQDKTLLAATSAGVYYLDPANLTPRLFFDTEGSLTALSVSDDGAWVATGDDQGTVTVWNIFNGEKEYQLKGQAKEIRSIDFSPDGSKLAFADTAMFIHLWDLGSQHDILGQHGKDVNKVIFSADGMNVYSGGEDFLVKVWDLKGKMVMKYQASQKINDMSISSNNQYLAVALDYSMIEVWDLTSSSNNPVSRINASKLATHFLTVTFMRTGTDILVGSSDGYLRGWNALKSDPAPLWQSSATGQPGSIKTFALSDDGGSLVILREDGLMENWDLVSKKIIVSRDAESEPVKQMAVSRDDKLLLYQKGDSQVELYSVEKAAMTGQIDGALPRGNPISPDGRWIVVQAEELNQLGLYSVSGSQPQRVSILYDYPVDGSVNFSPESNIVAASNTGFFSYWSTSSGRELTPTLIKTAGSCRSIFRTGDKFLAAGSAMGVIFINENDNLPYFCSVTPDPRNLEEDFLPDGSIITQSLEFQRAKIWNRRVENQKPEIKTRSSGNVLDAAISPDGTMLAIASQSGNIEIYNLGTKDAEFLMMLELRTGPVHQVLFSNNGKYLIAGSADGTFRIFGLYP